MTEFLIKSFVKNYDDIKNTKVRANYGTLSSIVGIVCNVILFGIKFLMGTLSGSIAIVSDAFNNLSDCLSCIVTLVSYKLAAKPADEDHPFGHGRLEYIATLMIALLVILVGLEFVKTSFEKILHPSSVEFSWVVFIALIASILIKLWMGLFNTKLGKKINSQTMLATAADSKSDAIVTSVTLVSVLASLVTDFGIDGYIGIVVSFMILKAGYGLVKDTMDTLLGQKADPEIIDGILEIVSKHSLVLGVHDMIVHNYGPGNMLASFHAEVSADVDIMKAHDEIDCIEHELMEELHLWAVIHMDPIETNNEVLNEARDLVWKVLKEIHPDLSMHDFRMVSGDTHTNLIFDVLVPYDVKDDHKTLKDKIDAKLHEEYPTYFTVITFDTPFH